MDLTPGELMRTYRNRKNLTQEELAEKVGSYQVRISRLENQLELPTDKEIEDIERILGTSIWTNQKGDAMNGA